MGRSGVLNREIATVATRTLAEALAAKGHRVFGETHPQNIRGMLTLRRAGFELVASESRARFDYGLPARPDLMLNVWPIEGGIAQLAAEEQLPRLVELPVLPACRELYRKGIRTIMSSANRYDLGQAGFVRLRDGQQIDPIGQAWIIVDYETLSEANRAVLARHSRVYRLAENRDRFDRCGIITHQLRPDSTIPEVAEGLAAIAGEFVDQPRPKANRRAATLLGDHLT